MSPTAYEEEVRVEERPSPPPTLRDSSSDRPLFESSMLESRRNVNRRRGWTTFLSLAIQGVLLCIAVLLPLIYTDALPKQQLLTMLFVPPPPPPPPPPAALQELVKTVRPETEMVGGQLRTPTRIPTKIAMIHEDQPPPAATSGGVIGGVPGGIPGGQLGGVIGGIIGSASSLNVVPKAPRLEPAPRVRISQGVSAGRLLNKVEPLYPVLARNARVQGQVVLTAIISKEGAIQELHVLSGHPLLVPAALDAVRQWRYKPYLLNGEPVEVETTVTVNFVFTS
ncbi:MAG: energy transducer TonB [Terriglobales bacterium]